MPVQDPLETLGLKSTASPDEIRQAYRDLVKVWHPDRFGTDARLRAKAEEHLKAINAAFHTLESSDFRGTRAAETETAPWEPQSAARPRLSRDRILRGWLYVGSLLLIVAMLGFAVHAFTIGHTQAAAPAIQQPSAPARPARLRPTVSTKRQPAGRISRSGACLKPRPIACSLPAPAKRPGLSRTAVA